MTAGRWVVSLYPLTGEPVVSARAERRPNLDDVGHTRAVITIHLTYVIDPYKLSEFEEYGRRWITLVNRLGGDHLGYFMPSEGSNNVAYALFTFPSLAEYEVYRERAGRDPECQAAMDLAADTRAIVSYTRTFVRPVHDGL